MLVNLTRCMRYGDDLSVTQLLVSVGLLILSPKTVPNVFVYRPDSVFQGQLGV